MGFLIAIIVIILALALPEIIFTDWSCTGSDKTGKYHFTEYQCPCCGSHDTDGNHCFDCGADF